MKITRIESILYGVEDLDAGIRFYKDWGLDCLDRGADGANFTLPSGQMVFVRRADDPMLPPAVEQGSSMREVTWGVEDTNSLQAIAAELSRDRTVTHDEHGGIHSHDPNHCAIAFRVAKPEATECVDKLKQAGPPVTPRRIAHVVYTVTKGKGRPTSDFYVKRLQFRISDRVVDNGDFLARRGIARSPQSLRPASSGQVDLQPCGV
jgi:hypothetical protein